MRVCAVTASLSRRAGGVLDAMRSVLKTLAIRHAVRIEVFGLSDEYTSDDLPDWAPLAPQAFSILGGKALGYARGLGPALQAMSPDLVHLHGLWMYPSVASAGWARRAERPLVVTPHGMLDPWALRNSRWKKVLAGALFERRNLREAACVHSLCEAETRAIRRYGIKNPVCQVPNGVDLPTTEPSAPSPWAGTVAEGCKVLLYLGRIHPKKGLQNLVRGWAAVRATGSASARDWVLGIAGWDQGGHETALRTMVESAGLEDSVVFLGPLFNEAKAAAYYHADAFVLPSFSEGLPMVVLEAWAYGLPVVMTPQCNLPEGFKASAALRVEATVEDEARGLGELFQMGDAERAAMGERGRKLVEERFTWGKVADEMYEVYQWLLGGGSPPACVIVD